MIRPFLRHTMQNKTIHIISLDNPFPPTYGGVIDIFYKIKAIHSLGYGIHLHCFVNETPAENSGLESFVEKVYYYKNKKSPLRFLSAKPYSVSYRADRQLVLNVAGISAPILFESLKVAGNMDCFSTGKKILRMHNIEHDYFFGIAKSESNWLMKLVYNLEGFKYRFFEPQIGKFDEVVTLSIKENNYINAKFKKSHYIPLFHGNETVKQLSGFGKYAIYSGDLRTSDNKKAVRFLVDAFNQLGDYPLLIAVRDNFDFVEGLIEKSKNIVLVKLQDYGHLQSLLEEAHINVMISFQESGTKLKLVNALFNSRHCLINRNMVDDDKVLKICHLASTKEEFVAAVQHLRDVPYTDYMERKKVLDEVFDDRKNAQKLMEIIFK